ncbi:signal-regulatory protein beta-1-like [Pelodiscus sinensis]|uniref:signal-regulatory protein beta-1-like n=1 Tax=Pelodiscus sinensis TaxID=13735 RepID=UPI003F6B0653
MSPASIVPPRLRVGSDPAGPVTRNKSVTFTCRVEGFYPQGTSLSWLENGNETDPGKPSRPTENPDGTFTLQSSLESPQPRVLPEHESVSYNVSSTVGLNLSAGDARSQLTCQIEHSTLAAPLRGTYDLSHALRVPPRLRVGSDPAGPVARNESVTFTCRAEGFYPLGASLSWLENGNETDLGKPSLQAENPDGTFTLQSSLEVRATEQRNPSVFTCRAVHDSQPPVSASATLRVSLPPTEPGKDPASSDGDPALPTWALFSSPALWIGLVLEKVLTGAFLFFLFLRSKG